MFYLNQFDVVTMICSTWPKPTSKYRTFFQYWRSFRSLFFNDRRVVFTYWFKVYIACIETASMNYLNSFCSFLCVDVFRCFSKMKTAIGSVAAMFFYPACLLCSGFMFSVLLNQLMIGLHNNRTMRMLQNWPTAVSNVRVWLSLSFSGYLH